MEKSMDILEKSFKIARLKAKKEVFDDIFKLIESLITVDAQLQHTGLKIDYNGKKYSSLTQALLERLDWIKKRHLTKEKED